MHQMTGQIVTSRTLVVLYLGSFLLCEIQESALIQEQELSVMFNANYGRLTEITNQGCIKEVRLLHSVGICLGQPRQDCLPEDPLVGSLHSILDLLSPSSSKLLCLFRHASGNLPRVPPCQFTYTSRFSSIFCGVIEDGDTGLASLVDYKLG